MGLKSTEAVFYAMAALYVNKTTGKPTEATTRVREVCEPGRPSHPRNPGTTATCARRPRQGPARSGRGTAL